MKRILLLSNKAPFPPRDGSSIAMASTIRGFLSQGVGLTVLTLNTAKHRVESFPKMKGVTWEVLDVDTTPHLPGLALNTLFSRESYMVSRFNRKDVRERLRAILATESFDGALIEGLFMMPYADAIKQAGIPVFMRAHNVEHHIWNRHIQREKSEAKKRILRLQNKRLKAYEEKMSLQADGIIPITDVDAQWFRALSSDLPVHTMPCGIDPKEYPHFPSNTPDVFHIGAMDWMPNVDGIQWFVREVWPLFSKINRETTFHLAGRDSEKLNLHDPSNGIYVEGKVESSRNFYEKHGIFVIPLLSGSGMRIKVLEAMAYGKAIIGTSVAVEGIPVVDGENGYIADNPADFAKKLNELVTDKLLRLKMGSNARTTIFNAYNEAELARNLLNFMQL